MVVMVTGGIGGAECECIISCKCGAGQCYIQSVTVSHSAWLQVIGVTHLKLFYVITNISHTETQRKYRLQAHKCQPSSPLSSSTHSRLIYLLIWRI